MTGPNSYTRASVIVLSGSPFGLWLDLFGRLTYSSATTSNWKLAPYAPARKPERRSGGMPSKRSTS